MSRLRLGFLLLVAVLPVVLWIVIPRLFETGASDPTVASSPLTAPTIAAFSVTAQPTSPLATEALIELPMPTLIGTSGNQMLSQPLHREFHTSALPDLGNFGYGPNAQVVLAEGNRSIQYQAATVPLPHHFALYRFTLAQFVARYGADFEPGINGETRVIGKEGAELVASWQEEALSLDDVQLTGSLNGTIAAVYNTQIPSETPPGLYLLEMTIGTSQSHLFVVLTHYTIFIKQGVDELVAWLTSQQGEPIARSELTVYDVAGSNLAVGQSDANGVARIQVERRANPNLLLAQVGNELTVAGLSHEWRSPLYPWKAAGDPGFFYRGASRFRVYLDADQPSYQLGQRVRFKATVRRDTNSILTIPPSNMPVIVHLRTPDYQPVQSVELALNAFGTLSGEFLLDADARPGEYMLWLEIERETYMHAFNVQESQPDDFMVEVTTSTPGYLYEQPASIQVESRDREGKPLANALVTLQRFAITHDTSFYGSGQTWSALGTAELTRTTDAEGKATFTLTPNRSTLGEWGYRDNYGSEWGVAVTVSNQSNTDEERQVQAAAIIPYFAAPEQIAVNMEQSLLLPNQPITLDITVTDMAGDPIAGKQLQVDAARWLTMTGSPDTPVYTTTVTTSEQGNAQVVLTLKEPHVYELTVYDPEPVPVNSLGIPILRTTPFKQFATIVDPAAWVADPYRPLTLALDRTTYLPGEEAHGMVLSRFGGQAWLTIDAEQVQQSQLITLTPPLTLITTTIPAAAAPNAWMTVNGWQSQPAPGNPTGVLPNYSQRNSFLYQANFPIRVSDLQNPLVITITSDQELYVPGQSANITVAVTDQAGNPVVAELSVALLDEAFFELTANRAESLYDTLYTHLPVGLLSFDNMAISRSFQGPIGGRDGGMGFITSTPHTFLQGTLWQPHIETGADGIAPITFALPTQTSATGVTTWRLLVKAITKDSQAGEAAMIVTIERP